MGAFATFKNRGSLRKDSPAFGISFAFHSGVPRLVIVLLLFGTLGMQTGCKSLGHVARGMGQVAMVTAKTVGPVVSAAAHTASTASKVVVPVARAVRTTAKTAAPVARLARDVGATAVQQTYRSAEFVEENADVDSFGGFETSYEDYWEGEEVVFPAPPEPEEGSYVDRRSFFEMVHLYTESLRPCFDGYGRGAWASVFFEVNRAGQVTTLEIVDGNLDARAASCIATQGLTRSFPADAEPHSLLIRVTPR